MTIALNLIQGNRRSACNNDAVAIVRRTETGAETLAILPLEELAGRSVPELRALFLNAVQGESQDTQRAVSEVCNSPRLQAFLPPNCS